MGAQYYGLTSVENSGKSVPLQSISVHADVLSCTAAVTAVMQYENSLSDPIECQFVFPLTDSVAVYRLEADIHGRKLKADCRPRREAEQTYGEAVVSGKAGVLLQSQESSPDVFRLMLGNLPASASAKVTLGYVQPVDRDSEGTLRLVLPSVLNPMMKDPERMTGTIHKRRPAFRGGRGPKNSKDIKGGTRGRRSKISEKFRTSFMDGPRKHFHFNVPSEVACSMSFSATINLGLNVVIRQVKAANEADEITVEFQRDQQIAKVWFDGDFVWDHDFGLCIVPAEPFKPMLFVELGLPVLGEENWLNYAVAAAWFQPESPKDAVLNAGEDGDEYWFLVDRSDSMEGSRIRHAKKALILFLYSLPIGCKFNVVGFGSEFETLFTSSLSSGAIEYSDSTLAEAMHHAYSMRSNLGGTNILRPLRWLYALERPTARRFIFLLTDGAVENTRQVINFVRQNASATRIFAIGIGEGASTALVNGLARVSGGLSMFVRSDKDRLHANVISLMKAAVNPAAENIDVKWEISGGRVVSLMPEQIPSAAYQGNPIIQYALIERFYGNNVVGMASLNAKVGNEALRFSLPVSISSQAVMCTDNAMPLHRLAAKQRLQELSENRDNSHFADWKKELVQISTATSILCEHTAFIAVDADSNEEVFGVKGRPFFNIEWPYQEQEAVASSNDGASRLQSLTDGADSMEWPSLKLGQTPSYGSSGFFSGFVQNNAGFFAPSAKQKAQSQPTLHALACQFDESDGQNIPADETVGNLANLVQGQRIDGSWRLTDSLTKMFGMSVDQAVSLVFKCLPYQLLPSKRHDDFAATLFAVGLLHKKFPNQNAEWELIERKATSFLAEYLKNRNVSTQFDLAEFIDTFIYFYQKAAQK